MKLGILNWFDSEKGYGLISTFKTDLKDIIEIDSEVVLDEVFLHKNNWVDSERISLLTEKPLVFNISHERRKVSAKNCRYFSNIEKDWTLLFNQLGISEIIEKRNKHRSLSKNIIKYTLDSLKGDIETIKLKQALSAAIGQILPEESLDRIDTLIKYRKETSNQIIKKLLDEVFIENLQEVENMRKFILYMDKSLPAGVFKDYEIVESATVFTIEEIRNVLVNTETQEFKDLIIKEIESIHEKTIISKLKNFEKLVKVISNESFKNYIIKELDRVAEEHLILNFLDELDHSILLAEIDELKRIDELRNDIPDFLSKEIVERLDTSIEDYIANVSGPEVLVFACLNGYISNPEEIILSEYLRLSQNDLGSIFRENVILSEDFKTSLFIKLAGNASMRDIALTIAANNRNSKFIQEAEKNLEKENKDFYFDLWKRGIGHSLPEKFLQSYLSENPKNFKDLEDWLEDEIIAKEELENIFINIVHDISEVGDRRQFHTVFNIIEYFTNNDVEKLESVIDRNNPFHSLTLWYLGKNEELDFQTLKGKFIYFNPDQQVRIIKRLFLLRSQNHFNFSIDDLEEIVRADLDLYFTNEKFNSEIVLDLSTSIIIEGLKKYQEQGKFLVESELLSIVLKDIGQDKTNRFELYQYFDICIGRKVGKYNWETNGKIRKVFYGDDQFYFAISFDTGTKTTEYNSYYGSYDRFTPNPMFEKCKEAVKQLPNRKWNPKDKHWGVPSQFEEEVLQFADENRFFLDFEGSNYENNPHLVNYKRKKKPTGIRFCEGQKAQQIHKTIKKEFWWCASQPCFGNVEKLHDPEEWESYSFLDFLDILGLAVIEENNYGTFEIGRYNQFISHVNRFNSLLERLYCNSCDHILYPVESSNYAAYTVVRFCCENEDCSQYKAEIYLNHCLNGKCNSVIDSRESKKCPNGLYICKNCGGCCSFSMFKRRLNSLENTGGYIHENLRYQVANKGGHIERAEYYCYSCGNMMTEIDNEHYLCEDCDVEYNTEEYNLDRSFKHLRRIDYPTLIKGNSSR